MAVNLEVEVFVLEQLLLNQSPGDTGPTGFRVTQEVGPDAAGPCTYSCT